MEKICLSKIQAETMVDELITVEQAITEAVKSAPWLPALRWVRKLEAVHSCLLLALDQLDCDRERMGNDGKR
ncbi:hypothetical protein B9G54_01645 [Alloscardovia macacae]|uniref:Uncharacterized protein n=1 Tax=Alloscardovia macacae TaxID=1160091 RepID=A0A1Y2SVG3_9BIFI|nr:hypothetical protein B9G54_01645 [Alloscardovia macacae]OTA29259.1 hypothetical protein B9T39_03840 [Alloscardovia macacae]